MNKKALVLALFVVIGVGSAFHAFASNEDNSRYFVQTNNKFWAKTIGVRHNFENGFTADLSDWQLRLLKLGRIDVVQVTKFSILPDEEEISARAKPQTRAKPADPIPWGVELLYQDENIAKTSGGNGVTVAVLDTGVLNSHPDLKNRIKGCRDFTHAKFPVVNGKCDDSNGHGTHVAGIIGADGGSDQLGIYGVAPEVDIFAYKVCGTNGSCWSDDVATAIKSAADSGANIINLSLGSDSPSSLITEAIVYAENKNVLVIAAAGNDGPYENSIDYPAALSSVVAVGAIDASLGIAEWSSRGVNSATTAYEVEQGDMEFVAPGVSIESTWKDGGYAELSGTSMAAPYVAGLAAKSWQNDAENPAQATRELLHNAIDLDPAGDDNDSGFGLPHI